MRFPRCNARILPLPRKPRKLSRARPAAVLSSPDKTHRPGLLELVIVLKALTEVAGLALIGQGLLFFLAGANRDKNFPYVIFRTVTRPVFVMARFLAPRFVLDSHIWLLAPALVIILWLLSTYFKITLTLQSGA